MFAEMGTANMILQFFEAADCPAAVIDRARQARESATRGRDDLVRLTLKMQDISKRAARMRRDRARRALVKTNATPFDAWERGTGEFIREPLLGLAPDVSHAGPDWIGPYLIWQGGNNICVAYLRIDDEQRIVDKFIRKDVVVGESSWRDVSKWDGSVGNVHARTHWEVACHKAMSEVQSSSIPGQSNILGYRGHSIDLARQTYTLFTEVADNGAVDDVVQQYIGRHIAEPFLWYVFEVLIECGLAMQYWTVDGEDDPEWRQVVHLDLKPANIFLGEPSEVRYPRYPAPKLGDFGTAFRTYYGDPANPDMFANGTGTEGYRVPECMRLREKASSRAAVDKYELGAHSNVYQVGRTMLAMMLATDLEHDPDFTEDYDTMALMPLVDEGHIYGEYSKEFVDLVLTCLTPRPDQRSTFRQLRTDLQALLDREDDDDRELNAVRAMRRGTTDEETLLRNDLITWDIGVPGSARQWVSRYRRFAINRAILERELPLMTTTSDPIERW